jgi:hypothetical protein
LGKNPEWGSFGAEHFETGRDGQFGLFCDHEHRVGSRVVDATIPVANLNGNRRIGIGPEHHADIDVLSGESDAVSQRQGSV